MEFDLKIGPQGHIYLPKLIRKTLGKNLKLLPNTTSVVIYPENADPTDVIRSLQVIISNLELRIVKGDLKHD
jgi:hypothetical protein